MTDKIREEFEAWASKQRLPVKKDGVATTYAYKETDIAWQAWKASRAAVVVDLPQVVGYQDDTGDVGADSDRMDGEVFYGLLRAIDVEDAIEAAGLRVKT